MKKEQVYFNMTSADELVDFYLENKDIDYDKLSICFVCAFLVLTRDTDLYSEYYIHKCLNRIMRDSQVQNGIKHCVAKMYGRYALDDFGFIYENATYDECYKAVEVGVREIWFKELKFERVANNIFECMEYTQNTFVRSFMSLRIKKVFVDWALEQIQKKYPEMTAMRLQVFVKMRKSVEYNMTLRNNTNEQIIDECQKNGYKISWNQLNALRFVLGYPEEEKDYSNVPLRDNPIWRAKHRNEFGFFRNTDADLITQSECDNCLEQVKSTMHYTDAEMSVLVNWLNRCRYEGVYQSSCNWVPESLTKRYYSETQPKNESTQIFFRMRKDIGATMGENTRMLRLIAWRTHTGVKKSAA